MTYAFIELPFNVDELKNKQKIASKSTAKQKANFKDAFAKAGSAIKNSIKNPTQTLNNLGTFLNDANVKNVTSTISNTVNVVTTKYSGIAMAQLLIDGKITSKNAIDYLFLGVAPALNQTGIALGYGGLNQLKNAMLNGSINVGQFISGFSKVLKGIYDEALVNNLIKEQNNNQRIYFDMTMTDDANYQSETPDRRVENGNDLSEFCHNLPPTFSVQCELQDNRRYSKEEFRGLLTTLRNKKILITLYVGDEHFENLIIQNFSPNGQGSQKGGFEYTLQFKQITKGSVEEIEIIAFADAPTLKADDVSAGSKAIGSKKSVNTPNTSKGKNNNVIQTNQSFIHGTTHHFNPSEQWIIDWYNKNPIKTPKSAVFIDR